MSVKCGIVGLPNVGKSTFFNAIVSASVKTENYPFCTIEPNLGNIEIKDETLVKAAQIIGSKKVVFASLEIIDIAGLVKGAHKGEGLGNKFLSYIREVDAILHLVRCFISSQIINVYDTVDPKRDIEIVNTELLLADLETVDKRLNKEIKAARVGDKEALQRISVLEKIKTNIGSGLPLRQLDISYEDLGLFLLTSKPVLYIGNFSGKEEEKSYLNIVKELAEKEKSNYLFFDCALYSELNNLDESERIEYMKQFEIKELLLPRLINELLHILDLIIFYTINSNEAHAWIAKRGISAVKAAGMVHSDFEKGFIKAECYNINELFRNGNENTLKESGLIRQEGRDYQLNNGEVVFFKSSL